MDAFKVSGTFEMQKGKEQPFTSVVAAKSEEAATEQVYSKLGSRHGVKRLRIDIQDVSEVSPDEAVDPWVAHAVEQGA